MFSLSGTHGAIYIPTKTFTDGQPHLSLPWISEVPKLQTTIFGRITNPTDLFQLQMLVDVLKNNNRYDLHLRLSYLMGGRMDRRIDQTQPATLEVVARTITNLGFQSISLYDCHSEVSSNLLSATNVLPKYAVQQTLYELTQKGIKDPVIVIPDKGATNRVKALVGDTVKTIQCLKTRNPQTQELTDMTINTGDIDLRDRDCLIIDDICDGGRTFINITRRLKFNHNVKSVSLFVTHGIFSYGVELENIIHIFTTNSYRDMMEYPNHTRLTVLPGIFTPIPEPTTLNRVKGN